MKLLFSIFFFCVMTLPCFAQDSTKVRSLDTFAVKPLLGLGLINGARAGLQIQYGDIAALEVGGGIDFASIVWSIVFLSPGILHSAFSQGLILTPFPEKRLSIILYNTYLSAGNNRTYQFVWQGMIGWSIPLGEFTHSRLSAGFSNTHGNGKLTYYELPEIEIDFVMTFDYAKIRF